jgi:hypothetical protein
MKTFDFSKIQITNTSDSQPDGYGGDLIWYYTKYSYKDKKIINNKHSYGGFAGISESQLTELIGKKLTLELRIALYQTNQNLFNQVSDMNHEIYDMVIQEVCGEKLIDLDRLGRKVSKLWDKYESLYKTIYGRSPSRYLIRRAK